MNRGSGDVLRVTVGPDPERAIGGDLPDHQVVDGGAFTKRSVRFD
jgi:hypothetical protein